jgi:transposase
MKQVIPPIKIRNNTGLRINERKAVRVAKALAAGESIRSICQRLHTSHGVVIGVQRNRPDLMARALTQAREAWSTLAAVASAELLSRIPEMTPTTLAKAAQVSARAAELMRGQETVPEIKVEPSSEEWAAFVERIGAERE